MEHLRARSRDDRLDPVSMAAIWEIIEVMNSWRVMRRFASQSAHDAARRGSDS
jgi:hypothetical protein